MYRAFMGFFASDVQEIDALKDVVAVNNPYTFFFKYEKYADY